MTVVIGIDPGVTTGYIVYDTANNTVLDHMEIADWYEVAETLEQDLSTYSSDRHIAIRVVIERFIINATTHKKTVQDEPKDLNGIAKYLTLKYTGNQVVQQTSSEAKTFATNDKLKSAGMWFKGGAGHANDASRHALTFMVKTHLLDAAFLLDSEEE